jgi:hypothetical protein
MKWYTVNQNNSGGYFIQNEDVNQYVSVQARNPEEADLRLEDITENYSEYCSCCGGRWYWYDLEGFDTPTYYEGSPLFSEEPTHYRNEFVMHYADGRKFTCKIGEVPEHFSE